MSNKSLKKNSVVLLQGNLETDVFDSLSKRKVKEAYVCEGRPSLDAAQKTCAELIKRKIKPTLIADNMAGFLFAKNLVKEINMSYQDIDKEGAVCQIGALILGVLGKKHKIPVNLYKGRSTNKLMGRQKEIFNFNGVKVAPKGIQGYVPLIDWVPMKYITKVY